MRPALLIALMLVGCASRSVREQAVDPPPWSTPDGKEQTRIEIAERLIGAGAYAEALNLLQAARDDGSAGPKLDLLTGKALYGQRMFSAAEPHLKHAADRLNRDPSAHRALGLLYADTDRPLEAIAALQRATSLDPSHAPSWNNLGYLLYTVQRDPGAIPALQKAVSLDGNNARYRRNLGFALFAAGRPTDAQEAFRAAGPPAEMWYNLGVAYQLAGDAPAAREHFERALQFDPQHPKAGSALQELPPAEAP